MYIKNSIQYILLANVLVYLKLDYKLCFHNALYLSRNALFLLKYIKNIINYNPTLFLSIYLIFNMQNTTINVQIILIFL